MPTATAKKINGLLGEDINFRGQNSTFGSHNLHPFPAKFPPQLPALFIEKLTEEGDVVLDPMMGSGTAIIEASRLNRVAWGMDFDKLAHLITKVKTTPLDHAVAEEIFEEIITESEKTRLNPKLGKELYSRFDTPTLEFINFWFFEETTLQLLALIKAIERIQGEDYRDFFKLVFSSIIITKTGGVTKGTDLAHSRPHLNPGKKEKDPIACFKKRFRIMISKILEGNRHLGEIRLAFGDARKSPYPNDKVSLIITSPPYPLNAIDYVRVNKFSLVWFGEKVKDLSRQRREYIGSEIKNEATFEPKSKVTSDVIKHIKERDEKRLAYYFHYLNDMRAVLNDFTRVLKPGGIAVLVVGSSYIREVNSLTHVFLSEIAQAVGFDNITTTERELDRDRRMMPARNSGKKTQIEKRMHKEYILTMAKGGNNADS